MTTYRKKLIEVALPLEAINRESAREKSIRHGHPSTLHLWWARRPLAACRAVLFASLVDDPDSDPTLGNWAPEELEQRRGEKRQDLFDLIEQLVKWENSNNEDVIRSARAEIARCLASLKIETGELKKDQVLLHGIKAWDLVVKGHVRPIRSGKDVVGFDTTCLPNPEAVNAFLAKHAPPVFDPFAGGGSIPFEAQRLGLRAHASDLNPVPVLINKALIEIPSKFSGMAPINPDSNARLKDGWTGALGLAEDVRHYGKWLRDEAERRIGRLYPKVKVTSANAQHRPDLKPYIGQELIVIAWLWARTVVSPDPSANGTHVPLVHSFWLGTKKGREAYIQPIVDRKQNTYQFIVKTGKPQDGFDPDSGTKDARGANFRCVITGSPIPAKHVRAEFTAKRSGNILLAIVAQAGSSRVYLSPNETHASTAAAITPTWQPDIEMNTQCRDLVSGRGYGVSLWSELFTPRQLVLLDLMSSLVHSAVKKATADAKNITSLAADGRSLAEGGLGYVAYAHAIATYLGLGVSKVADYNSSYVSWIVQRDQARSTFSKQAVAMIWDFCEVNPFVGAAGDLEVSIAGISRVIESCYTGVPGQVEQLDATASVADRQPSIVSTDPPYYDNISYADLSDFFYIWQRRSLASYFPMLFSTVLTPKTPELIASEYRHNHDEGAARRFFEDGLGKSFAQMRLVHPDQYPLTVYYAFKQTETDDEGSEASLEPATASTGWETMLEGLIHAGFAILGTWPMRTERGTRTISLGTNALASSIILSCRPRHAHAPLATRREFLAALKQELPDALKHLQRGSIAPVDLAQAAIGPGMAVFTRYSKVMEADGSPMKVRQALSLINQTLDEVLAEQEGEFDTDTRWAVAWFEQFGMEDGAFGMAETLSKAKNTAVNGLEEAGIIRAKSGKVRLLKREELSAGWDPTTDNRVSAWEVTQYLIRALETGGETAAATLLRKLGGLGETARDLAYRLFHICERKGWASEAISYNGLVIAWPELSRLARATPSTEPTQKQTQMF